MASFSHHVPRAVLPLSLALTVVACVVESSEEARLGAVAQADTPTTTTTSSGPQCNTDAGPNDTIPGWPGYLGYGAYPGAWALGYLGGYGEGALGAWGLGYPAGYGLGYSTGYLGYGYPTGYFGGFGYTGLGYPGGYGSFGWGYPGFGYLGYGGGGWASYGWPGLFPPAPRVLADGGC
jgi:hypothetical protein